MENIPVEQSLALIDQSLTYIKRDIEHIKGELDGKYVTQSQFEPIRKIVYGLVGLTLISVFGAIIAVVIR